MKHVRWIAILVALLVVIAACSQNTAPDLSLQSVESSRYLVLMNGNSIDARALRGIEAAGGTIARTLPQVGIVIATATNPDFASNVRGVRGVQGVDLVPVVSLPEVAAVEPAMVPDPPSLFFDLGLLWGIERVQAPAAWEAGHTGSHDTVVAVLDTGIASNHPDLGPNLVYNNCFVSTGSHATGACTPYPSLSFHGTHVAGTVAANFGGGVVGVGPNLGLANYNVFEFIPGVGVRAFFDSIWAAMLDAADEGFDVINMSLGALGAYGQGKGTDEFATLVAADRRVSNYVIRQGVTIVASAGNANVDLNGTLMNLPGGQPGIINVGATGIRPNPRYEADSYDVRAFYSNYGAAVDISAPGGDCGLPDSCDVATRPANWFEYLVLSAIVAPSSACAATESCAVSYGWKGGTSMAAPHVSGVAGLVKDANPRMTPRQIAARLTSTADRVGSRQEFGHGVVNAWNALNR